MTEQIYKPGDKVWCIEASGEYDSYLYLTTFGEHVFVLPEWHDCKDFEHQIKIMAEYTDDELPSDVYVFRKDHVFATSDEAYKKSEMIFEEQERSMQDEQSDFNGTINQRPGSTLFCRR